MPGNIEIEAILKKMGKTRPEHGIQLRLPAATIPAAKRRSADLSRARRTISMCLPYLLGKSRRASSDTIINNTPNAHRGAERSAGSAADQRRRASDRERAASASDVLGKPVIRILDPQLFSSTSCSTGRGVAATSASYLVGIRQVCRPDRRSTTSNYHILMLHHARRDGRGTDPTPEKRKNPAADGWRRPTASIDKQMRVVQQIASLLGRDRRGDEDRARRKLKESLPE